MSAAIHGEGTLEPPSGRLVSWAAARGIYGVLLTADGEVDTAATAARRAALGRDAP